MTGTSINWWVAGAIAATPIVFGIALWPLGLSSDPVAADVGKGLIGIGLLILLIDLGIHWRLQARDRLAHEGIRGTAKVLEMTELGTMNERPLMKLRLLVEAPGIEPYELTKRVAVPHGSLAALQLGAAPVAIDPKRRKRVILDLAGSRQATDQAQRVAGQVAEQAAAAFGAAGRPDAHHVTIDVSGADIVGGAEVARPAPGADGRSDAGTRLEQLEKLRDEGLITAAEYEQQRSRILEDL